MTVTLLLALSGCAAEPKALYFSPEQPADFALCGKPAPAGDAVSEFVSDGRRYRMLWVKGTLCEFSDEGAFLQSYRWGASPANATHVLVDRSGALEEDMTFGPVATTGTQARIGRAALIDAAALAVPLALILLALFLRSRRRTARTGERADTGLAACPAIIVEDNVFADLNVVRALGAGAVLGVTNGFPVNVVDPRRSEAEMKAMLGDVWYIFNADDLDHQFEALLAHGHAERFDWLIARSLDPAGGDPSPEEIGTFFDEPSEYAESVANLAPAVQWLRDHGYVTSNEDLLRGTCGYDIDRAAMLVRAGLGAGYISRRNALDMVIHAGQVARMRFGSWREFATSVLLGRAIWGGVADSGGQFAERAAVVEMLLNDPASPWLTAGWWPPRDDDAGGSAPAPEEHPDRPAPTVH